MTSLALSVCMLFMTSSFSSSTSTTPITTSGARVVLADEEARFMELTNAERLNMRLGQLNLDPALVEAAREHSREMYELNYFAHESPNVKTLTPMRRYLQQLPTRPVYAMVGENLFYCSKVDVNRGHSALMASHYHRENILNPKFDSMGVGVWKGADGSFWVTEMFLTNSPSK